MAVQPRVRTEFLNVDIDVKSVTDPGPFLQALGSQVLSQRIGMVGRSHWVRLMLAHGPTSPSDAILGFEKLLTRLSPENWAIWVKAATRELDIGIQGGFEPSSAEWVLGRDVVEAAARIGAQLRITVYSPDLLTTGSPRRARRKTPARKQVRATTTTSAARRTSKAARR